MATSKILTMPVTEWQNLPSGDASGYDKATLQTAIYSKVGRIVFLSLYNNTAITSGWKNIGKLLGFRPTRLVYASGSNRDSKGYEVQIQDNGNVFINGNANFTFVSLTVSFLGGVIHSLLKALQSLTFRTERGWA